MFALGLIEAGGVAILTISASTAYAAGECVGVSHSFNNSPRNAAVFYTANVGIALLAAVVILIPGAPLLSIALNANVLATVLLPVSLVLMVMLANDEGLMGPWVNRRVDQRDRDHGHRVRRALRSRLRHRLLPAERPPDRLMTPSRPRRRRRPARPSRSRTRSRRSAPRTSS